MASNGKDDLFQLTPEELDHTPLNFGKYGPKIVNGVIQHAKTPVELSEGDEKEQNYVVWAYENVERRDRPEFCSNVLYRSCGGKFLSAKQQRMNKEEAKKNKPYSPRLDKAGPDVGDGFDDDISF